MTTFHRFSTSGLHENATQTSVHWDYLQVMAIVASCLGLQLPPPLFYKMVSHLCEGFYDTWNLLQGFFNLGIPPLDAAHRSLLTMCYMFLSINLHSLPSPPLSIPFVCLLELPQSCTLCLLVPMTTSLCCGAPNYLTLAKRQLQILYFLTKEIHSITLTVLRSNYSIVTLVHTAHLSLWFLPIVEKAGFACSDIHSVAADMEAILTVSILRREIHCVWMNMSSDSSRIVVPLLTTKPLFWNLLTWWKDGGLHVRMIYASPVSCQPVVKHLWTTLTLPLHFWIFVSLKQAQCWYWKWFSWTIGKNQQLLCMGRVSSTPGSPHPESEEQERWPLNQGRPTTRQVEAPHHGGGADLGTVLESVDRFFWGSAATPYTYIHPIYRYIYMYNFPVIPMGVDCVFFKPRSSTKGKFESKVFYLSGWWEKGIV